MNNYLFDTHAHIYKEYYDDINLIIENAIKNNINCIINSAVDINSMNEVLTQSSEYKEIYVTLGIHPENVETYKEEDLNFIRDNITNKKVLAIGEIGLDYHYTDKNKNQQKILFERQLKIAEEYNIPVVIHSRDATLDTLTILKKYKTKGVIHSFSGSLETAMEYINLGYLLGINGVVTFKNSKMKDYLSKIPLNNIVLETDSPYLTPEPFRGYKNEPANIYYISEFIANIYETSTEEITKITTNNVKRIFDKIN